jgi:hypothetical protein
MHGPTSAVAGAEYRDRGLSIAIGSEYFDLAIDDHVQEVRRLAFAHQFNMRWEPLQVRNAQHVIDVVTGNAGK